MQENFIFLYFSVSCIEDNKEWLIDESDNLIRWLEVKDYREDQECDGWLCKDNIRCKRDVCEVSKTRCRTEWWAAVNAEMKCDLRNLYGMVACVWSRHRKVDEGQQGRTVLLFGSDVEKPQSAVCPILEQCGQWRLVLFTPQEIEAIMWSNLLYS